MKIGLCDSHLCIESSIFLPSPTFQTVPSCIISLAASRLRQPYIGRVVTKTCIHERAIGKISCFVHPIKQRVSIVDQPPYLFS